MRFGKKQDVRFQLCIKPSGFLVDACVDAAAWCVRCN